MEQNPAMSASTLIAEYKKGIRQFQKGILSNLRGGDLGDADLSGANLSGANLSYANLRRANLSGADLSGADLSRADLSRANLCYANLIRADLRGADLSGADLIDADLSGADLSGADLSGASLCHATIDGAILVPDDIGGPGHILYALTEEEAAYISAQRKNSQPTLTLEEWLEGWEQAVSDGESSISRAEAIRRWWAEQEDQ